MIMKKILYIISLAGILSFGLTACKDYLDINESPNSVSSTVPTPDQRLQSIQMQFVDCYESSGTRGSWFTQNTMRTYSASNSNWRLQNWDPQIGSATWPYQAWFVYCACNLEPLIEKATAEEAWNYVGAAQLIHAWGFMTMLDVYGEMPYTDAMSSSITPKYDDGKTIYFGCMDMLDKAIENLSKTQPATATSLASGDCWNGGDINKWLKLAYGLKARWLNQISKKASYSPDAVLAALEKAPQSNADNTVMNYINSDDSNKSGLRALQNQNIGGTVNRIPKFYKDLLTNEFPGGSGVKDPRLTRLVPSAQYLVNGVLTYKVSEAVNMQSDVVKNGPVTYDVYALKMNANGGKLFTDNKLTTSKTSEDKSNSKEFADFWYNAACQDNSDPRYGDSVYVSLYAECLSWVKDGDDRYKSCNYNGMSADASRTGKGQVISTGTFYTRADAPGHLVCYPEMCFIKAEAYFRKGDKASALNAYKAGIRAHMELMNEKLIQWDQSHVGCEVIPSSEIDAFMSSAAVAQTPDQLTMSKIMQQKYIACSYSIVNWNDMRRFNYSAGNINDYGVIYPGYDRPSSFNTNSATHFTSTNPKDDRYYIRRLQQCSHEVNYNIDNLKASNSEATLNTINSLPVWWDTKDE
jgi:hypothetical protein